MTEKIMLAEDDEHIAELVRIILEAKGYTTAWAQDGQTAVELAKTMVPDLILLDVMMPKLNGYEVLKLVKEDPKTKHIPVIFLTVKGETDSKVVGLRMGGHDYITKPFDLDELIARVESALRVKGEQDHLKEVNHRLAELSMTDPLTSLYNRRYLMERIHEEIERANRYKFPISCLILDIDDFKSINDRFGHIQGDQVLQKIAQLLKHANRVVDILARFGGEEFIMILPQTDLGGAETLGRRLVKLVAQTQFIVNHPEVQVTVSLGAAAYPTAHIGKEQELLEQADKALYEAKRRGKNQLVSFPFEQL